MFQLLLKLQIQLYGDFWGHGFGVAVLDLIIILYGVSVIATY